MTGSQASVVVVRWQFGVEYEIQNLDEAIVFFVGSCVGAIADNHCEDT